MTRRAPAYLAVILGVVLVACSRGSGNGTTPSGSAVAGDAATATRGVELTEIARLRAAASANAPGGTPSALGSVTAPFIITPVITSSSGTVVPPATRPAGTAASPAAAVSPVASTTASGQPLQVVKVTADDGVNVRQAPDANAPVIIKADYGAEFPFVELDVVGTDGTSHWVHVNLGDKTGYIRKDLVTGPQAPSPPTPTPDPRTPTAAPSPAASPPAAGTPRP